LISGNVWPRTIRLQAETHPVPPAASGGSGSKSSKAKSETLAESQLARMTLMALYLPAL